MEKKELQYKTYNDKVYFYYGENLIFQSGKSIPFIVLKKIKNDVKTSTSLYKHTINKTDDGYEIEFSSERNKAVVKLTQKENAVNFEIKCDDEYDELCFTLYKRKDYKIYGLPTYEAKEIKRTFREKLLRKKPQIINPERKLSFYVSETYYFENINITEYSYEIKDNIYITTGTKNPEFRLIYAKNIYAAINTTEKNNPKIKKYNTGTCFLRTEKYNEKEIAGYCKEKGIKIDGIIIEKRIFDRALIKPEVVKGERNKLDIIYALDKIIGKSVAKRYFNEDEYEYITEEECKVKLDSEDSVRKYLVTVRKYLDEGAAGIYFDGDFTKKEILQIKEGMKTVVKEYLGCTIFHSTLTESNDDFGYYIIKDKNEINEFNILSGYYLYSGEYSFGKEESALNISSNFSINIIKKEETKRKKKRRKDRKRRKNK